MYFIRFFPWFFHPEMRVLILISLIASAPAYLLQGIRTSRDAITPSTRSNTLCMCAGELKTGSCKWFNAVKVGSPVLRRGPLTLAQLCALSPSDRHAS